jgi:dephospho-CoA kinase
MIIGIAGPIASGKSTFARSLAGRHSFKLIGFGEYVRRVARARGLDAADRRVLQDLGQSLVDQDVKSFVEGVFDHANFSPAERILLDGIRHETVWDEIIAFAASQGSSAKLIFLEMPEEERQRRLSMRGLSEDQANAQDTHASEADVRDRLLNRADLRLGALQSEESMLASIAARLGLQ